MKTFAPFACAALTFASIGALAGESLFSRAYTTETVPAGHYELEQAVRNRTGRAFGEYSATDFKTEFEYGLLDNFQVALYLNTGYLHALNAPDDNEPSIADGKAPYFSRDGLALQSVSVELIYRLSSPVTDPLGVALYFEPEWNVTDPHNGAHEYDSLSTEFRLLLQKNFLGDQLVVVYNLVIETDYFRYGRFNSVGAPTPWQGELDWNNEIGASLRLASNWYGGVEFRNHNEVGNFYSHDHTIFWGGPAFHYASTSWWATLGVLKQLWGGPDGIDSATGSYNGDNYYLHSHEMWESTLKVALTF